MEAPFFVKVVLNQEQIRAGVERLAGQVRAWYEDRPITVVGVMTGSLVLLADLIRLLDMPLKVGLVQAASYEGTNRRPLSINPDMMPDVVGHDVLLVDDIFDTGHTLVEVVALIRSLGPKSLRSAVLLRKEGRQQVEHHPDFVAFDIDDQFVVGYGLDYCDAYRNLPYVAALEPDELHEPAE
jgi:hypoxanthine phosphoribosyltransferase